MITREQIRTYARLIGREFHPQRVILFGSYVRGQASEDSDVDLLVVMDHDMSRNVDQAIAIRLGADAPFPMDLLVRRPSEVAERLAMNDSFVRGVVEDGEVVYE